MKTISLTNGRPHGVEALSSTANNNISQVFQASILSDKPKLAHNSLEQIDSIKDKVYFEQYTKFFEVLFNSGSSECTFVKDANLVYQAVTDRKVQLMGASSAHDMIGKTFAQVAEEFPLYDKEMIDRLIDQDQSVILNKKTGVYLEVLHYKGERKIFVHYKHPIINSATGNCVGIRGQITSLILPHVVKTLFQMHGTKGLLLGHKNNKSHDIFKEYPLSAAQHMVLFLALNNYSYSEIAVLLCAFGQQVTPIRVNDYLEQLKLIFHVRNKVQLIEKAIGLGLHTLFPEDLFNKLVSVDISSDTATITNSTDVKLN